MPYAYIVTCIYRSQKSVTWFMLPHTICIQYLKFFTGYPLFLDLLQMHHKVSRKVQYIKESERSVSINCLLLSCYWLSENLGFRVILLY